MQNYVFAQAGSFSGSSSNRLNAPKNTGSALSATNFTVSLSMPDGTSNSTNASANTTGLTTSTTPTLATFTSNWNTTNTGSLKGYYITNSATQPFATGTTTTVINNNRAKVIGSGAPTSGLNTGSWLYNAIGSTPTAADSPPLQQQGSSTSTMAGQTVSITFTNPGVYYVWAYVTISNSFFISVTFL